MSFSQDQLALLMPYTKKVDKTAATFFKAKNLEAATDLRTLLKTYDVPLVGRIHNGGKAALQALICQILNDLTCLQDIQGRARHDWDIGVNDLASMPHGTLYVALHGWSDDQRKEWSHYTPSIKAELSTCFCTWHWSGDNVDLSSTPVVPIRVLYSPLAVTASQVVDVRCWLTGVDLPSAREHARGYALICVGSQILFAPMRQLLEEGKEGGPLLSVATDTKEAKQAIIKGCIQVTCFFSERLQCKSWTAKYALKDNVESTILQRVKDAIIHLDDNLTVPWGIEFDRRVQVAKDLVVSEQGTAREEPKAKVQPQKQFLCSACDRSFRDNTLKRSHVMKEHPEVYQQWQFGCDWCNGRWESKRGLSVHKKKCPNKN